ncbi:MAG TPA: hypothetical protein VLD39_01030, partial [Gammaproteobacteria bacterium]|nr:hypothetical protein [Gammaproteobacteria bacterium]
MPKDRAPSYTAAPAPPKDPDLRRRYDEVMAVLSNQQTVAGAARSLGLSRNHFQTLLHRALQAMIDSITPKPAGRPARPAREVTLEAENARLSAENATLRERTEMVERLLELVGGIASGREPLTRRAKKSSAKKDEDPEPALEDVVTTVCEINAPTPLRARALGVSVSTLRRRRRPRRLRSRPHRSHAPQPDRASAVRQIVRETHGLVGAASLARSTGVSRRQAAQIKRSELVEMERDRKARCARVRVTRPGVVRGFDAMHMTCDDGRYYWLIAADAAVPYRTSITTVRDYDHASVIAALTADFEAHGPPLIMRLDRAACQRTPEVQSLLTRYDVLPLHGPPRHPQYYGQLERQNREHRAWLQRADCPTSAELPDMAARMRTSLNALWARPTLDWCTAEQAWEARSTIHVDRRRLRQDVERHTANLVDTRGLDLL